MSEDTPQFPVADESQRIDDPEKAHTMALAGHLERSNAAERREEGYQTGSDFNLDVANEHDKRAENLEEEAGKEYDESRPPFTADEFVEIYTRGEYTRDYLDSQVIDNLDFLRTHPGLAAEICEKLAELNSSAAPSLAAALITEDIDKQKGIDVLIQTLNSDDVNQSLHGLETISGNEFFKLPVEEAWPLIKAYDAADQKQKSRRTSE